MRKIVRAFAPATVANVSCGFDVLGLALEGIGDIIELSLQEKKEITISEIVNGGKISLAPQKNSCSAVIKDVLKKLNIEIGINIRIIKGYRSGSGLGSSAASSAAAAVAINEMLNLNYEKTNLVKFAMEGERIACGTPHADNVAAAIFGGISLVKEENPLEIVKLPVPDDLHISILFPDIKLETSFSRKVLSKKIELKTASKQWGNLASFVSGLYQSDYELISRSMKDEIAEEKRAKLIPAYYQMKNAALKNGALGLGISGSGPTVFALVKGEEQAYNVKKAMEEAFHSSKLNFESFISKIRLNGAEVINSSNEDYHEIYQYKKQVEYCKL